MVAYYISFFLHGSAKILVALWVRLHDDSMMNRATLQGEREYEFVNMAMDQLVYSV